MCTLGPRAAAIAKASIIPGKAKNMSVIRITTSETMPPRYPAMVPATRPRETAIASTANGTSASIGADSDDPAEDVPAEGVCAEDVG